MWRKADCKEDRQGDMQVRTAIVAFLGRPPHGQPLSPLAQEITVNQADILGVGNGKYSQVVLGPEVAQRGK